MITKIKNISELKLDNRLNIIKFSATWCGPCKKLHPIIDKLSEEFNNISFFEVDIDDVPELSSKFKIKSLPTVVLVNNGEEVDRVIGLTLTEPLRKKIREFSIILD